jgi:hypothetical protein
MNVSAAPAVPTEDALFSTGSDAAGQGMRREASILGLRAAGLVPRTATAELSAAAARPHEITASGVLPSGERGATSSPPVSAVVDTPPKFMALTPTAENLIGSYDWSEPGY